jgi:hypothetical protein
VSGYGLGRDTGEISSRETTPGTPIQREAIPEERERERRGICGAAARAVSVEMA